MRKREAIERIGLRVILIGSAGFAVLMWAVLSWLLCVLIPRYPLHLFIILVLLFAALVATLSYLTRIYYDTLLKTKKP